MSCANSTANYKLITLGIHKKQKMKRSIYLSSLLIAFFGLLSVAAKAQPVVTTDPIHDTVCTADTAYFNVAATGTALTYRWEFSNDGGTTWDTVTDGTHYFWSTNDTLGVIGSLAMNGYHYRAIAIEGTVEDTSAAAMLTVDSSFAGVITGAHPLCATTTASLMSSVAGGTWSNMHPSVATINATTGVATGVAFGFDTVVYTINNTCGTFTSNAFLRVDTAVTAAPIVGPSHVCVGGTVVLSNANVLGTGVWSFSNGNASITSAGLVSGVSAGLDTVTYNFTNGCSSVSSSMEVLVEAPIPVGTIAGPSAVCRGSWITLTSSVMGGVWISSNPSVAVVSSVGNVTGVAYGTSVISYYRSNSCGASVATHLVNVDAVAATITGIDSVGIDSVRTLSNLVAGGEWTSSNVSVATVGSSSGVVTGVAVGTSVISYAVTNTCGTTASSVVMHVGALPNAGTLSGPDTVCVGDTVVFTPSLAGGTWANQRDTISTVIDGSIIGLKSARDTIYYYYTNAFGRSRIQKTIFVHDVPQFTISGPITVSLGASYTMTVNPTSASGGTWTSSNPSMATIVSTTGPAIIAILAPGTTIISYSLTNRCGTTIDTFSITLEDPNVVKSTFNENASFKVWPNPSNGSVTLNVASITNEQVKMTITNLAGQVVATYPVSTNTDTPISINQPAGAYLLSATTADGSVYTARIIVAN